MGKMNKEWHSANRMPKNASLIDRIEWHIKHAKYCGCREMPESIKKEIGLMKK